MQQKISGGTYGMQPSPYQPNPNTRDLSLPSPKVLRKPMEDVVNVEVLKHTPLEILISQAR